MTTSPHRMLRYYKLFTFKFKTLYGTFRRDEFGEPISDKIYIQGNVDAENFEYMRIIASSEEIARAVFNESFKYSDTKDLSVFEVSSDEIDYIVDLWSQ